MSVNFATKISIQKYSQSFQLNIYNIRGAKKSRNYICVSNYIHILNV